MAEVDATEKRDDFSNDVEKVDLGKVDDSSGVGGFATEEDALPEGYFSSSFFVGSMFAIGMGLLAAVSGFGYAAPILGIIDADIGPDPNAVWISLSYTLTVAVALAIVGRTSDIFGRRWIFIGGAALGLIGSIVCATATSVPALIGGTTLIGLASSTQLSYYYVMGELVPMKYRFLGNGIMYIFTLPGSGFAPAIGNAFILYTGVGWRGLYYVLIAINGTALACWYLFYHPPNFEMKHRGQSKLKFAKKFDWIGLILYTGGLLIFLMGLSWGGTVHPWDSADVIATLVIGFMAIVAFICWETFANLEEPLMPLHLFKNIEWVAAVVVSGLGASIYYAFSIVWPQMVIVLYQGDDQMYGGWLSTLVGVGIIFGEIVSGFLAKPIGKIKWQCFATILIAGSLFAAVASCTPDTKVRACVLVTIGVFSIGWTEGVSLAMTTISLKNQQELGTGGGLAGSIRFVISSVASTVYTVVLNTRLAKTVPAAVTPAVTAAGLPDASVPSLLQALSVGTEAAYEAVKGLTPDILAVATDANKHGSAEAYKTVFLTTIAFTGIALIASLFLPNAENLMTGKVATTLHKRNNEDVVGT
ncbi:hypothetical protein AJ80_09119 [Polytolypa hystricis UAMH7299]|uniref:Major facilitator superfamily (MFS) profile domain-containing protein n=1 Tax=Polytolypa hystricis (strain UAMH7299) TaxID=1447883 RepID=A0A2B7WW19_POLH7|nr:hypothetical protein AJ80_09119 [Polytolypa hystricis UAMH7299]